jgi:tubulin---tyrosine ligase
MDPAYPLAHVDELRSAMALYEVATSSSSSTHGPELALDCVYSARHWRAALHRRPWLFTAKGASPVRLCIVEYEAVDWDAVFSGRVVTNNLCVRKGLSRKGLFAHYLQRHAAKCKGCPLLDSLPPTAIIDTVGVFDMRPAWLDFRSALAEALCDASDLMESCQEVLGASTTTSPLFILKPSLTNKGAEITIVSSMDEVAAVVRRARSIGQWVLQRYVERPLLISGRKSHLRVYVLADGALSVHVWGDALVLSAVSPYDPSDRGRNVFSHITNTAVGAEHADFDETAQVMTLSEAGPHLIASRVAADLEDAACKIRNVWRAIESCIVHTFSAFDGDFSGFMPLSNAFELYGFDFLLDETWRVFLLEANPTPDIRQTGDRLDPMIGALIEGVARISVDQRFPPLPSTANPLLQAGSPEWAWRCVLQREWAGSRCNSGAGVGLAMFGGDTD